MPTRSPTQLLDEWAACMRSHGDPNSVDPALDTNTLMQLRWGAGSAHGFRAEMANAVPT